MEIVYYLLCAFTASRTLDFFIAYFGNDRKALKPYIWAFVVAILLIGIVSKLLHIFFPTPSQVHLIGSVVHAAIIGVIWWLISVVKKRP